MPTRIIDDRERRDWIARYEAGESMGEIARSAGIGWTSVRSYLKRRGVLMRTRAEGLAVYRLRHYRPGRQQPAARQSRGPLTGAEWVVEQFTQVYPDEDRQEWITKRLETWKDGKAKRNAAPPVIP